MLRSSLCDYSDVYILVEGTITVPNTAAAEAAVNNTNKRKIITNCAPFTHCTTEINNTQVDDAQKIDIVTPMYNLIEYSDAYLKTSEGLWQYQPALSTNGEIIDFSANNNNSASFKFKQQDKQETMAQKMLKEWFH